MVRENMHIHTKYSWDCNLEIRDIVKYLYNSEIKYMAFTDHVEFNAFDFDLIFHFILFIYQT